ncbi:hypothetical protein EJB05_19939, partial [Eragrostis curvula]
LRTERGLKEFVLRPLPSHPPEAGRLHPAATVAGAAASVLQHLPPPAAYQHTAARRQVVIRPTRSGSGSRWYHDKLLLVSGGTVTAFYFVSGGTMIAYYFSNVEAVPFTSRTHFITLTTENERELGESVFADLKKELASKILPPEDPECVRVGCITSEIVQTVHRDKSQNRVTACSLVDGWEVIAVRDKMIDAMCLPGGKIVVFTGLLNEFKEDAEVATVLGHEVGHAIARHTAERITNHMWFLILQIAISKFVGTSENGLGRMFYHFVSQPFTRRMEMEADHVGLMLLAAAGYDPRVVPGVYEKLGKVAGDSESTNYISTHHPSSKERSQYLS